MVEHSPQILASWEKATTTTPCKIGDSQTDRTDKRRRCKRPVSARYFTHGILILSTKMSTVSLFHVRY